MADSALSCPLCLTANDPADMLGVVIMHAIPAAKEPIGLCKRCVLVIVKFAMAAEFISVEEVFPDAPANLDSPGDPGSDPAPAPASDSLVPAIQPDGEGAGEHRPEPEVPAGGETRARRKARNHE